MEFLIKKKKKNRKAIGQSIKTNTKWWSRSYYVTRRCESGTLGNIMIRNYEHTHKNVFLSQKGGESMKIIEIMTLERATRATAPHLNHSHFWSLTYLNAKTFPNVEWNRSLNKCLCWRHFRRFLIKVEEINLSPTVEQLKSAALM